jgi:cell division septation protein DedD
MYYVQLGAFGDVARAFALYDEARAAGVDARVVRVEGSNFTHVRVGRFAQREAAVELRELVMAKGINAALVRDERAETVVRERR